MRRWLGPVLAVSIALGVFVGLVGGQPDDAGPTPAPDPTEITSDAPRLADLTALVASSDLVVRGHVLSTGRGRTFGEPGTATVESRLVRLAVDAVLHEPDPGVHALQVGDVVRLEVEGIGVLEGTVA